MSGTASLLEYRSAFWNLRSHGSSCSSYACVCMCGHCGFQSLGVAKMHLRAAVWSVISSLHHVFVARTSRTSPGPVDFTSGSS